MNTEILLISILLNIIGTSILGRKHLKYESKQQGIYLFEENEQKQKQLKENKNAKHRFYLNWLGFILNIIAAILQIYVIAYQE